MEKMFLHVSCKWKVENSDDLHEYTKILLPCFVKEGRGAGYSVLQSLASLIYCH